MVSGPASVVLFRGMKSLGSKSLMTGCRREGSKGKGFRRLVTRSLPRRRATEARQLPALQVCATILAGCHPNLDHIALPGKRSGSVWKAYGASQKGLDRPDPRDKAAEQRTLVCAEAVLQNRFSGRFLRIALKTAGDVTSGPSARRSSLANHLLTPTVYGLALVKCHRRDFACYRERRAEMTAQGPRKLRWRVWDHHRWMRNRR
jgi:hypothetical protein